jgi:uncharacterized membrane protein
MDAKTFIKQLRHDDLTVAIRRAERMTSAEIRVFITRHKPEDALAAAQKEFAHLGMKKTSGHNGVLIYVAPLARKFAIIGDTAVHEKCGEAFWKSVAGEMEGHFRSGKFTEGITHGIEKAGELLARHFPAKPDRENELPDEVETD